MLDAKLLQLFDLLYTTGSVTRCAEQLGQSQPTVSIWLAKLRHALDDPLFVRTAAGMQPTPRADALIGPAREVIESLRRLAARGPAFDPAQAQRSFRVCMTDASHITLLPRLLAHLRRVAPGVRIDVAPIDAGTAEALQAGKADIALGYIPGLESGFYQQTLYAQDFVCLVNQKHPRIGRTLTRKAYQSEAHIEIVYGRGHALLDGALKEQRIERHVLLELPGFLGLATIVSSTDLIATVPRMIGETLAGLGAVGVYPCPFEIPSYLVKQHWHARQHDDPGHRWLRSVCSELFMRLDQSRKKP
ncbi:LysR family transcriptional regulator [Rhodoferax koreense]|uniref:LysR family transcriptional regulator n=1 Tax=Rhodoferax koreensis TaxID=1842727 RepID=A0A1P8K3B3_9BURK|nr:LysR family transcriptional regulator [Rhodoferax koreense]